MMQVLYAETKTNLCFRSIVSYPERERDKGKYTPETQLERGIPNHRSSFACSFYSIAFPSPIPSSPNPASDFVHGDLCVSKDAYYPKYYFQSLEFLKGLSAGRLHTWKIDSSRRIQLFRTDLSVTNHVIKKGTALMQDMQPQTLQTCGKTYVRKHI